MEKEIETADNINIIDPISKIHSFTKDDFLATTLPYDFLYSFNKDKFKFEQYRQLMAIQAKEVKISGFNDLFKNYISTYHKEVKPIYANFTEFEGQSIQLAVNTYATKTFVLKEKTVMLKRYAITR